MINTKSVIPNISHRCDHLSILIELNLQEELKLPVKRLIREYKNDNLDKLNNCLQLRLVFTNEYQ